MEKEIIARISKLEAENKQLIFAFDQNKIFLENENTDFKESLLQFMNTTNQRLSYLEQTIEKMSSNMALMADIINNL